MREVLSIGYNGPACGLGNDTCKAVEGKCGCIHAEANALIKLRNRSPNNVLISTAGPCEHCAGLILNSQQVAAVLFRDPFRDETGITNLREGGVRCMSWEQACDWR